MSPQLTHDHIVLTESGMRACSTHNKYNVNMVLRLGCAQVADIQALAGAAKAARVAAAIRTAAFLERWRADMAARSGRLRDLQQHWCARWEPCRRSDRSCVRLTQLNVHIAAALAGWCSPKACLTRLHGMSDVGKAEWAAVRKQQGCRELRLITKRQYWRSTQHPLRPPWCRAEAEMRAGGVAPGSRAARFCRPPPTAEERAAAVEAAAAACFASMGWYVGPARRVRVTSTTCEASLLESMPLLYEGLKQRCKDSGKMFRYAC